MKDLFLLDPERRVPEPRLVRRLPATGLRGYQQWQRELEREPVEFLGRERRSRRSCSRRPVSRLAAYLGADPANLAFAPNASTALNAVARSLELGPGDEVLLGDDEYGGMDAALGATSPSRTGATARAASRSTSSTRAPRTRVVFCSHVEWTTGRVNDVAELCRRAREAGALSIVDGAHAPGQLELDLDAIGADVYAGNCHKWLCAPKGLGVPLRATGGAAPRSSRWSSRGTGTRRHRSTSSTAGRERATRPPTWPCPPRSTSRTSTTGRRCARAATRCSSGHASDFGLEPLTDDFVQMLGFRVDHPEPEALKRRLYDEHRIEVPVFETPHGWALRVSVQAYNDEADLDALVAALQALHG